LAPAGQVITRIGRRWKRPTEALDQLKNVDCVHILAKRAVGLSLLHEPGDATVDTSRQA
jgi:hypothetical protein